MIPTMSAVGMPAASSAPTIEPADVPAIRLNSYPCSSSTATAPTSAIPLTPPPSSARSAFGFGTPSATSYARHSGELDNARAPMPTPRPPTVASFGGAPGC